MIGDKWKSVEDLYIDGVLYLIKNRIYEEFNRSGCGTIKIHSEAGSCYFYLDRFEPATILTMKKENEMIIGKTYKRDGFRPFVPEIKMKNGDWAGEFNYDNYRNNGIVNSEDVHLWSFKPEKQTYYSVTYRVKDSTSKRSPIRNTNFYPEKDNSTLQAVRNQFEVLRENEIEVEV